MVKSVYGPVLLCHSQLKHKIPELFISKEVGRRGAEEGRRGVGGEGEERGRSLYQLHCRHQIDSNNVVVVSWCFNPSQPQRITSGLTDGQRCEQLFCFVKTAKCKIFRHF